MTSGFIGQTILFFQDFFFVVVDHLNLLPYCSYVMVCFFDQEACGIEPFFPAVEGDVLTTGLPGKPLEHL